MGTNMPDACGIAQPAGRHRHVDARLLHRRRLTSIPLVQEDGTPSTAVRAAAVPLLALPGPAIADEGGSVTGGTGQDLEHPDATRWQ